MLILCSQHFDFCSSRFSASGSSGLGLIPGDNRRFSASFQIRSANCLPRFDSEMLFRIDSFCCVRTGGRRVLPFAPRHSYIDVGMKCWSSWCYFSCVLCRQSCSLCSRSHGRWAMVALKDYAGIYQWIRTQNQEVLLPPLVACCLSCKQGVNVIRSNHVTP